MANKFRVDSEELRARLRTLFGSELRIDRELGRGGMAAVFLAFDPGLERQVAVKLLLPDVSVHGDVVERFLREARTVAALQHPHIVSVYGVRSRDDAHAILMQFVDGTSLDTVVAERGARPPAQAARLLSQVAAGLQHAHDRGVVHRDVKPANVLVDDQGNAYVSDFGIARRNDAAIVTKTGLVLGSWDYMSPEQRAGERVTAAADQYAFGVMAFEVFTGRLPFPGTPAEVIRGHMETPAPSMRAVVPELTPAIDALIARMLAKDPADRWPSLVEARQRLDELADGRTSGGYAVVPPAARALTTRAVAIGVVVLLLSAIAVWALGAFGS
ncbi:serine/threonine-protein kinase [Gemmatimonas sp.]|uniref:serine/threonine-protein kinase n=1 Tax=Gemmatimonas sp. TaxID=1962908 RepID=UPI00286D9781|nr:serine/threonine-protein kinase [Gemmatimonas sp.]